VLDKEKTPLIHNPVLHITDDDINFFQPYGTFNFEYEDDNYNCSILEQMQAVPIDLHFILTVYITRFRSKQFFLNAETLPTAASKLAMHHKVNRLLLHRYFERFKHNELNYKLRFAVAPLQFFDKKSIYLDKMSNFFFDTLMFPRTRDFEIFSTKTLKLFPLFSTVPHEINSCDYRFFSFTSCAFLLKLQIYLRTRYVF